MKIGKRSTDVDGRSDRNGGRGKKMPRKQTTRPLTPADLQLIVYDFDGVMTDNRVYVGQDGTEFVGCHRGDGLGVDIIRRLAIPQILLSTEENPVVQTRARKLKLKAIHGCSDKRAALSAYCSKHSISLEKVLYVGNDVNDLDAMQLVGWPVCPADAHLRIRRMARVVLETDGGRGVVRELADLIHGAS